MTCDTENEVGQSALFHQLMKIVMKMTGIAQDSMYSHQQVSHPKDQIGKMMWILVSDDKTLF